MKPIEFFKYQGTGNDFVMIDNRNGIFDRTNLDLVRAMCHRHFGIGADGLILIENSKDTNYEMVYFNSDGSKSFCGNGSRCSVAFAKFLGIVDTTCTFDAIDGIHLGAVHPDGIIGVSVKDVIATEIEEDHHFIHTGSPHYIVYVDDLYKYPVIEKAREIRYNDRFRSEGTNVNFVQIVGDHIRVRTYERGVEDETLSCGSGVTACAISFAILKNRNAGCKVETRGGNLSVNFTRNGNQFTKVILNGPAEKVFKGKWNG